jgi:hypothetical protein
MIRFIAALNERSESQYSFRAALFAISAGAVRMVKRGARPIGARDIGSCGCAAWPGPNSRHANTERDVPQYAPAVLDRH